MVAGRLYRLVWLVIVTEGHLHGPRLGTAEDVQVRTPSRATRKCKRLGLQPLTWMITFIPSLLCLPIWQNTS
jgi:hypothetical protein